MNDLQVLKKHRPDLLLAEVAAWLHDVGKLSSEFLDQMSRDNATSTGFEHESAIEKIPGFVDSQFISSLKSTKLRTCLRFNSIKKSEQIGTAVDLILHHDKHKHSAFLVRLLNRCDGIDSGVDKGTTRSKGLPTEAKQPFACTFIATAFGDEEANLRIDTGKMDSSRRKLSSKVGKNLGYFLNNPAREHHKILRLCKVPYQCGLGETRRSANDVTLWDHSFSVATLYKTSLAEFILNPVSFDLDNLRWHLLRVNFDVLGLYAKAVKIGDLLGYRDTVNRACAAVKQLIEEEYPLGNEIYRDSTGIYFTFPDLDLPANLAQEIRRRVEEAEMELAPHIAVVPGKGNTAAEQLKGILGAARRAALEALEQPFASQNLNVCWQQQWQTVGPGKWETCPVCGLRPKREERDVCQSCEKRRKGRVKEWLGTLERKNPSQPTIWTNEVADQNGRLALIIGSFDLTDWLSGDLVQTMLVKTVENAPDQCVPKNPSPARLRRVWETTQRFWESALKDEHGAPVIPDISHRLVLEGNLPPSVSLNPGQAYDLLVHGFKLSVVWDGERFLVCDNPAYFEKTTEKKLTDVLVKGASFTLTTSEGYKKQDREIGKFTIAVVGKHPAPYAPVIPILAEPQVFMALVPAEKALEVARAIKTRYEREMGKVRNRLPLHLGVVFAGRRIPLQAILDAGRAMLRAKVPEQGQIWSVVSKELSGLPKDGDWPAEVCLRLEREGRSIEVKIPTVMGDGETPDRWYPYVFLKTDAEPTSHRRRFQAPNPWTGGDGWLVHAGDLKEGDEIYFTPSTFDFEYLDSTARRFDIYYDDEGRRPRLTRPYYLEDLKRLEEVWCLCRNLKRSQFSQMLQTIEAARERWNIPLGAAAEEDAVFCQFVEDTLANAHWPKGTEAHPTVIARSEATKQSPPAQQKIALLPAAARNDRQALITAAARGELADLAELHLEILKENMKGEAA